MELLDFRFWLFQPIIVFNSQSSYSGFFFFSSFYLNKVIIFTFFLEELQLHTIKCGVSKLKPNNKNTQLISLNNALWNLEKMNKVLSIPLFRYAVNFFSFFLFPSIIFFSVCGGRKELKSWSIVRKFLLLFDFIKQLVDKGFCLILISPSPTVTEGSVQSLITYWTSFCIINSQIPFYPYWNSLPFFFSCSLIWNAPCLLPSILGSSLPPKSIFFIHPQTFQIYAVHMKHKTRPKWHWGRCFHPLWNYLGHNTNFVFCSLECYGTVQSGTEEFNKSGEELWKSC